MDTCGRNSLEAKQRLQAALSLHPGVAAASLGFEALLLGLKTECEGNRHTHSHDEAE